MNDNYMKTILSGVKEWTENLTDDALDKANNALDKANNALDKALFVVNITTTDGETFNADKTFDEIVQAYNEKKYNIVVDAGNLIMPFLTIQESEGFEAIFGCAINNGVDSITITDKNEIKYSHLTLATTKFKLPNPYPLTFTGAVNETYDGSSAKTIEIPSGGGSGSYFGVYTVEEDVSQYRIPFEVSRYRRIVISVNQPSGSVTSLTIGFSIDGLGGSTAKEGGVSRLTYFMFDVIELTPGALNNNGKYAIYGYSRRSNNPSANTLLQAGVQYVTTEENSLVISGNDGVVIPQGSIITITATP